MELKRWLEELVKVEDSDLAALETVLCGAHPGGFDAYLEELEAEQGASQCNVVWTYGAIAYRCRDCQINDASAICVKCFQEGDHRNHDYVMYRSESGGCCDCGDPSSWNPKGACKRHRHQEHSADTPKPLPGNLGQVTETAVAAVVAQLVLQVGKAVKSPLQPPRDLLKLIAWLDKVTGAAGGEGKAVKSPLQPPRDLLKLIAWLDKISHAAGIRDIVCARMAALLSLSLPVSTMAEEVVTQEATLFLLLLYSPAFKNVFSALLIRQYPLLVLSVLPDHNPSARFIKIEKALDRVMVQLFNIPEVTMHWVLSGDLLHLFVSVFCRVIQAAKSPTGMLNCESPIIWPRETVMHGNLHPLYSRPLHDMRLIFSHTPVVNYLLTQRLDCLADLLLTLSLLQGMNPYVRFEYGDPTEGTRWTKAVTLEMLVIGLIDTITERYTASPSTLPTTILAPPAGNTGGAADASGGEGRGGAAGEGGVDAEHALLNGARIALQALLAWLVKNQIKAEDTGSKSVAMSLHLPLHRILSLFFASLVHIAAHTVPSTAAAAGGAAGVARSGNGDGGDGSGPAASVAHLRRLLPLNMRTEVLAMAEHPLRLFAWMAQIRAREWHYQGEDLSKLERVYRGGYWPAAMDLDLLLLQLVSLFSNDSPAALLASAVKHFTLHDTFSKTIQCASATSSSSSSAPPSADWTAAELSRLADLLKLVLLIIRDPKHTGFPEDYVLRYHVIQWLAVRDRTHSDLSQQLGSSLASLPHLSAVLQDVAEHHVPRRLQQRGYFQLKPACWEEFDPLFPHFSLSELEEAQERAEKLAPKVRFWRVQCPQRQMAPFDRLPDMAHTEPCHIVVRCAVACAAHLLASRNPAHSTQAENIALLATQLVTVAATDARSNPSWLWKEAMVLGAPVSSSPSRPPVYPPGLYSTKKPGSSGSSGSGGSGGSGGGGESEWDSERLQSVRSRSSGAAAADDDEGRTIEESEHGDAAENGADGRKEDVSKQRDVPAEATKADLAQASVAAETSAVEADGTSGARNPPRNGEERGSGRRSSSSRSPDLRQQCDAGGGDGVRSPDHRRTCDGGRGDGMRSPDPRRTRDGGRGDGVRSPDPRRTRDGGSGDGVRSPDPRRTRDGGRGDGVHSPDPRRTRDGGRGDGMRSTDPRRTRDGGRGDGVRSPDPRRTRDGGSGDGVRSPDPRRTRDGGRGDGIRGEIATGEAEGIRARQSLVTRVMRDAEEAIARRTCNGTVERSGETRRTRPTGACVMGKAGEADIAHRIGSRAGMGGAVVGLDRLAGIGSTTEDVPDREGGSNMAIEKKAVGWCTAWSEPRKQGRAYSGQKEGEHQGDRWEGRARHGEKEGEARPWA
ncbi:unnamed protein product [Closterium sp. NIES-64]|nr:unnamed protein product [Closterium sp. NIES-64]